MVQEIRICDTEKSNEKVELKRTKKTMKKSERERMFRGTEITWFSWMLKLNRMVNGNGEYFMEMQFSRVIFSLANSTIGPIYKGFIAIVCIAQ